MSKKISAKKKKTINLISRIIFGIFFILLAIFLWFIIKLDVLPTKYFSLVIGILSAIVIIQFITLFPSKIKAKIKITSMVFAVLFSAVFIFGIKKLYTTTDFLSKITNSKYQIENYLVVVLDNQTYDDLDDLGTDKMGIYKTEATTYKKAVDEIKSKTKTKNTEYEDISDLANDLLTEEIDAMFISESYKANIDEQLEDFSSKTKVIYTVSIKTKNKDIAKKVKVTKQSFNIFVSGIDTYGKISSVSRSDVNMILTVNPNTHQILLTSIPRDYYVQLHGTTGLKDKLTHAGIYGVDKSVSTVEDLFGIDINYYFKVNFTTLIDVVDVIGGIDIDSDKAFRAYTDPTVYVKKGINHFNGKQALAYSRERYAYQEGDRHRVQNQQDVITAILNKILSSKTLISKYDSLLNTLKDSFQTNLDMGDLTSLIKQQINSMPKWEFINQSVNGSDSHQVTYSYAGQELYVMIPDMNTVTAATAKIKEIQAAK